MPVSDGEGWSSAGTIGVCNTFFLVVLSIGRKAAEYAFRSSKHSSFLCQDMHGRKRPIDTIPEDKLIGSKDHIMPFPA